MVGPCAKRMRNVQRFLFNSEAMHFLRLGLELRLCVRGVDRDFMRSIKNHLGGSGPGMRFLKSLPEVQAAMNSILLQAQMMFSPADIRQRLDQAGVHYHAEDIVISWVFLDRLLADVWHQGTRASRKEKLLAAARVPCRSSSV